MADVENADDVLRAQILADSRRSSSSTWHESLQEHDAKRKMSVGASQLSRWSVFYVTKVSSQARPSRPNQGQAGIYSMPHFLLDIEWKPCFVYFLLWFLNFGQIGKTPSQQVECLRKRPFKKGCVLKVGCFKNATPKQNLASIAITRQLPDSLRTLGVRAGSSPRPLVPLLGDYREGVGRFFGVSTSLWSSQRSPNLVNRKKIRGHFGEIFLLLFMVVSTYKRKAVQFKTSEERISYAAKVCRPENDQNNNHLLI